MARSVSLGLAGETLPGAASRSAPVAGAPSGAALLPPGGPARSHRGALRDFPRTLLSPPIAAQKTRSDCKTCLWTVVSAAQS